MKSIPPQWQKRQKAIHTWRRSLISQVSRCEEQCWGCYSKKYFITHNFLLSLKVMQYLITRRRNQFASLHYTTLLVTLLKCFFCKTYKEYNIWANYSNYKWDGSEMITCFLMDWLYNFRAVYKPKCDLPTFQCRLCNVCAAWKVVGYFLIIKDSIRWIFSVRFYLSAEVRILH